MSMLGEQGLDRRPKDGTTVQELVDPDPRYPRISRRIYGDPEIMGLERRRNLRTRVVLSRPRVGEPGAGRRRGARARRRARDPHTRAIRERWPVDRPRADFERDVWHADEILQGLDPLSRFACLVDASRESTADTQVMAPPVRDRPGAGPAGHPARCEGRRRGPDRPHRQRRGPERRRGRSISVGGRCGRGRGCVACARGQALWVARRGRRGLPRRAGTDASALLRRSERCAKLT